MISTIPREAKFPVLFPLQFSSRLPIQKSGRTIMIEIGTPTEDEESGIQLRGLNHPNEFVAAFGD